MDLRPRVLSVCAGIGGLDLGIARALPGARAVCYVEREARSCALLVERMESGALAPAPIWTDARTFDGRLWRGAVDLVAAGFPCQPFSTASRGRRTARDLWPAVRRIVAGVRAPWVFLENVQRAPIERASEELQRLGYATAFDPFDAAELGSAAPRRRWWLLAHAHDAGKPALSIDGEMARVPPPRRVDRWAAGPCGILGMDARLPDRMDRLRALGNAVVPQQAAHALRELLSRVD